MSTPSLPTLWARTDRWQRLTAQFHRYAALCFIAVLVQVYLDWRYTRHWPASSKESQEYGGSKYRHDPALDRMKPGEALVGALPYKEFERTQRPGGGSGGSVGLEGLAGIERMYPFQLGPVEAVERAQERIRWVIA